MKKENHFLHPIGVDDATARLKGFFGLLNAIDQRQKRKGMKGVNNEGEQSRESVSVSK